MNEIFVLSPPSLKAGVVFFILAFLIPVGVLGFAFVFSGTGVPVRTATLILIAALIPFIAISWSAFSRRSLEINSHEIIVKAAFYTTRISRSDIRSDARVVDLGNQSAINIASRVNGIGLPGYQAGWFSLKNGRGVFCSVTDKTALYIPTTKNFDLILSLPNSNKVLDRLKNAQ
ncbi:PH domain-containing protein [Collimonas silvisoli]|uniref:PH domain-containing protein n=1 Tax=Collimonas silvisoli TaxID=2825884 RepID=UPI001B8BD056|nr:PH domain-containing protein [Collimonas silvisoli]